MFPCSVLITRPASLLNSMVCVEVASLSDMRMASRTTKFLRYSLTPSKVCASIYNPTFFLARPLLGAWSVMGTNSPSSENPREVAAFPVRALYDEGAGGPKRSVQRRPSAGKHELKSSVGVITSQGRAKFICPALEPSYDGSFRLYGEFPKERQRWTLGLWVIRRLASCLRGHRARI